MQKNINWSEVRMNHVREHVEVSTMSGQFLFSEDNEELALAEIARCLINSLEGHMVA